MSTLGDVCNDIANLVGWLKQLHHTIKVFLSYIMNLVTNKLNFNFPTYVLLAYERS